MDRGDGEGITEMGEEARARGRERAKQEWSAGRAFFFFCSPPAMQIVRSDSRGLADAVAANSLSLNR